MSEAARRAPRLSRKTFRKTCAEARSGAVFSAAMHSGRHIRRIRRSVWSKRSSNSATVQSVCSCQSIQRAVVEKRASASLSARARPLARSSAASRCSGAGRRGATKSMPSDAGRIAHLQRQAQEGVRGLDADGLHQAQRVARRRPAGCAGHCRAGVPFSSTARARPPRVRARSNRVTRWPRRLASTAAAQPAQPAPTTATLAML